MEQESLRSRNHAKYGAACAPCASAKAKCIRSNNSRGTKCDRCERLFKDCMNQIHRPRKKRAIRPSKTAQLEQRLNGLVNLLKASGELRDVQTSDASSITPPEADSTFEECYCLTQDYDAPQSGTSSRRRPSSSPDEGDDEYGDDDDDNDNGDDRHAIDPELLDGDGPISIPKNYNSYAPRSCICRPPDGEIPIPHEQPGESFLTLYQTELSPLFPFVIIPVGTSDEELQASRPFLYSAIKMVTTITNMRSMRAQMYRLVRHVSEHMLLRSERSLDLLQGIIVMLGWYQHHCLIHAQLNNLVHLAASLVGDLGLGRQPRPQEKMGMMTMYWDEPAPRTNEEKRALLGVWYLTSCISLGFGKIEPMKYSPYVQQCQRELRESREYDTDVVLVHIIQVQHLMEKISRVNARDDLTEDPTGISRAPASAYTSAFQCELENIKSSLSKSSRNNKFIMAHIHSATMRLYEPPVPDASLLSKLYKDMASLDENAPSALDIFYRASKGIKDWFDHWFTIPVSSYFYLPMPMCCQLIYAVFMISRWAQLVSPLRPSPTKEVTAPSATVALPGYSRACGYGVGPPPAFSSRACDYGVAPPPNFGTSPPIDLRLLPQPEGKPPRPFDPRLAVIIAKFKEQVNTQSALRIDVTGVFTQLSANCQQASVDMMSIEGSGPENNIWDLSAKKLTLVHRKLERWAEIVAQGGGTEGANGSDATIGEQTGREDGRGRDNGGDAAVQGAAVLSGGGPETMGGLHIAGGVQHGSHPSVNGNSAENSEPCNDIWSTDVMAGLNPYMWYYGLGDFTSIVEGGGF
ncbi:hypothetical protein B0T17DRAFT_215703 [Bombardia bombarda]|uniref:Zn(2)-C6 fungal-type domain-containing protein n=1 Tax=Bombardia bombarda TaxID=252184 RepID=A0AA39XAQ8_9PEZI|nr:hypothetical protein B0T17DRAFT_215703 [Bombardia bombarda]